MPCLYSEALECMESGRATPEASPVSRTGESLRRATVTHPSMVKGIGWFFSPLFSPRSRTHCRRFEDGMGSDQVEAWLDDHSDFTRPYFSRRASAASGPQVEVSQQPPHPPRSNSDHSDIPLTAHYRRGSSPLTSSNQCISTPTKVRRELQTSIVIAPDWMDRLSPDTLGSHSPCSPRSSNSPLSPCSTVSPSLSATCLCSARSPQTKHSSSKMTAACGKGEGCPWMTGLLRGGLRWVGSVAELCQGALLHAGELVAPESCSLSLVKKDRGGGRTLEEVAVLTMFGHMKDDHPCSQAYLGLVKGIMEYVLATGSPVNIDADQDHRFDVGDNQSSGFKLRSVLSMPIKNHREEVLGVMVMINKRNGSEGTATLFTDLDEKVLANHMDILGMVLDNALLYESSRQEAKRSQALIEMAHVLSEENHSFEVLLSKMSATIMPFTHAQYCTIFITKDKYTVVGDQDVFSRVIHTECEELGPTCQIYRREHDISNIDSAYALRTLVTMETLNMSDSSPESTRSLICCPVRNARSEKVIAVCQLMNKQSRDSEEMEAFNRYDERLLEDLAVYCSLALQYVQTVQITEKRRASIEVTQEVLAYHITATEEEVQALQEATIPTAESLNILDFHFSDVGLAEELTTQATVRMFLDLNLVQDFSIDYRNLCQWVLSVKRGYRNNVPYHNWSHGLSTAQAMFSMLMATDQFQAIFSRLEILALMIATLNHDLDHRGVSNSYIERSHQPLAQLYSHSSLENHHYNFCLFLLNNSGSQILSGLSKEDYRAVLSMIKRAILATDLTIHVERRAEFFSLVRKGRVSWKTEKQRDLLRSMLMTASDLCAITKPWPEQKRIANLVAMEFFAQGDKEKEEFNIKPIDVMNRENSTRLPHMQVEYIDEICHPLYKALSGLSDSCSPLLIGCEKNRENWLRLAKEGGEESENNGENVNKNLKE
ncbi:cGMP-specific 3',5'-cyclic phosphodiesterase [Myripristis murdjan]|uniref:cGMP-specific 3',5'-cyclic phosphodiesterase n=1 Tax=Myripristis murdjan TaxID=586833 RepID=UPI0011763B44|nr:cGMP-specific 3',5'-cyclic phosphodiesterase-like [Myripristis murdjan]